MAIEIERKFRLLSNAWKALAVSENEIKQGYLQSGIKDDQASSVRVRIEAGKATLNIKSATMSVHRSEYEYSIPLADAEELLATLCEGPILEKKRYRVPFGQHVWEIDVFEGENSGLEMAEVEIKSIDEAIEMPEWVGDEVSDDKRFYNIYLLKVPFNRW